MMFKLLSRHACIMYIKYLYAHSTFNEYLHMVYMISLKINLYISKGT